MQPKTAGTTTKVRRVEEIKPPIIATLKNSHKIAINSIYSQTIFFQKMTFKNSHICPKWPEKKPYGNAVAGLPKVLGIIFTKEKTKTNYFISARHFEI